MAGNEKLAQMTAPLLDKWLDKMNKYGMLPNAFVDALTCANGAKAVYDFRRTEYMERGKSAAEAEIIHKKSRFSRHRAAPKKVFFLP